MSDQRPYVVPRITDRGTILLLDDEQHEFHLQPHDAAELAIQILRTYCKTWGFAVHVPVPDNDIVAGFIDVESLRFGANFGMIVGSAKAIGHDAQGRQGVYEQIKDLVLSDVRSALGIVPT